MEWKRHTLVDISDAGRAAILAGLAAGGDQTVPLARWEQVLLPDKAGARIPGIVRRADPRPPADSVPVGFCGPFAGPGGRLRIAALARREAIIGITTPYELMALPISAPERTASLQALLAVKGQARRLGIRLGVWGSAALEICTGLPFTHPGSDLDLLVPPRAPGILLRFLDEIRALEKSLALRIDVELDLPDGYGVQLKELLGGGRQVLGKSYSDVALLPRETIWAGLPGVRDYGTTAETGGAFRPLPIDR